MSTTHQRFMISCGYEFFVDPPQRVDINPRGVQYRHTPLAGYTLGGYPYYNTGMQTYVLVDVWCDVCDIETHDLTESYQLIAKEDLSAHLRSLSGGALGSQGRAVAFQSLMRDLDVAGCHEVLERMRVGKSW